MKAGQRSQFDFVPVLGVLGLIFVVLFFLLFSLGGEPTAGLQETDSYALFHKLFRQLGYQVQVQYTRLLPRPEGNLLVYFDYEYDRQNWQQVLRGWVKPGGTVLMAGISDETDPVSSHRLETDPVQFVYGVTPSATPRSKARKLNLKLKEHSLKHLPYPNHLKAGSVLLESTHGPLLYQTTHGAGKIMVLTDSSLLQNDLLREGKTAIYFNRLLEPYFLHRIYIMDPNTARQTKPVPLLALLFRGKLGYLTLQLLLLIALFGVWQGKRFGRPQTAAPYARRTLTEHLSAVGNWYQKTGSIAMVDEINCGYFRALVHKATGLQLKEPLQPDELEKLQNVLATRGLALNREQLWDSLTPDPRINLSALQKKEKLQDRIVKILTKHLSTNNKGVEL